MGGARALFASLGASVSFMAGAALSLLAVATVFGYHAATATMQESRPSAVNVSGAAPPGARSRGPAAVVVVPAPRPPASKPSRVKRRGDPRARRAGAGGSRIPQPAPAAPGVSDLGPIAPPAPVIAAEPTSTTGDGVREVGDALSATVHGTTGATGALSVPLGPPVTEAVQKVLDVVTALLHGATTAIGATADATLP
jgi:hypothetical protein